VPAELNPVTYQDIYAIAKEALLNAFRHSHASEISVEILFEPARLTLDIADNGVGINSEVLSGSQSTGHWGLAGMQERAQSLAATLKISRQLKGGTHIRLSIPGPTAFRYQQKTSMFGKFYRGLLERVKIPG
jgi:signal transduction histidine kinase